MTLPQAIKSCYSKYCTFQGRASRSEYWWFYFFRLAFGMVMILLCGFLYGMAGGPGVGGAVSFMCALPLVVFVMGSILPALSVLVRRLHDTGRSGAWVWLFIPLAAISDFMLGVLQYVDDHRAQYGLGEDWSVDAALMICKLGALLPEVPWLIMMCRRSAPESNLYGAVPEGRAAEVEKMSEIDVEEALKKAAMLAPDSSPK